MKNWFINLSKKGKNIAVLASWGLFILSFILIGSSPTDSENMSAWEYFLVILFMASLVFAILFTIWKVKYKDKPEEKIEETPTKEIKPIIEQKPIEVKPVVNRVNVVNPVVSESKQAKDIYKENTQYLFLDVETANLQNNTICSIGSILVENGVETEKYSLVNPNSSFSAKNKEIHGICEEDVEDCDTFDCIWEELTKDLNEDAIIIAHNASFDISVIKKDLRRYGLSIKQQCYLDTMQLAKKYYYNYTNQAGDLKLTTLADTFDIPLSHHNALSDVRACKEIFEHLVEEYSIDDEDDRYSISSVKNDNNIIPAGFENLKKVGVSRYWNDVKARVYPPYFTMFKDVDISENPYYDEVDLETLLYATMKNRGEDSYTKIVKEYKAIQNYIEQNGGKIYSSINVKAVKCYIEYYYTDYADYIKMREKGIKIYHSLDVIKFIESNSSPDLTGIILPKKK